MRGPRARAVAAAVVAGGIATVAALGAAAGPAHGDTTAGDSAEAWYTTAPADPCSSPVGCPPVGPSTAYPANTLHVGAVGGQETSRAYVAPDLSAFASGGPLPTSGTMTLPLDTSDNTAVNVPAATMEACLVTSPITDGTAGSTSTPPKTDCTTHSEAQPGAAAFTVDLGPFLAAWAQGAAQDGIALLPDPSTAGSAATWQVSFDGKGLPGATPISSSFADATTAAPETADTAVAATGAAPATTVPAEDTTPTPPDTSVAATPDTSPGTAATPAPLAPPTTSAAPAPAAAASGSQQVEALPAPAPASARSARGFQYPGVLLLPLVFAAAILYVARLLTTDATPRRRS